tara:strand:+ start:129 stop:308 length:180 start_codon:yes stop_codon:yes gene_type:complete
MSNVDLICASEVEEFFYEDSDVPVSEGEMVGVEVFYKDRVDLVLFDGIYWSANNEEAKK